MTRQRKEEKRVWLVSSEIVPVESLPFCLVACARCASDAVSETQRVRFEKGKETFLTKADAFWIRARLKKG